MTDISFSVFEKKELEIVLSLQKTAYQLFLWIDKQLKWGKMTLDPKHTKNLSPSEATKDWVGRNHERFPRELRISKNEIDRFSNLLTAILTVSFEPDPGGQLIEGCDCGFCALFAKTHYRPLRLSSKDRKACNEFIVKCIKELAEGLGMTWTDQKVSAWIKEHDELNESIVFFAYGCELFRRSAYSVTDPVGVALWRRLPKKKAKKLSVDTVLLAEQQIKTVLREIDKQLI